MEIKVFLVDDELRAIEGLTNVLQSFFQNITILGYAHNVNTAHTEILKTKPDLIFLDIEMGNESGFQLLEKFDKVNFHVVFLTAHEEFALKAIKFSALDYIIKPAEVDELQAVFSKVEHHPLTHQADVRVKHMIGNFATSEKADHKITISVSDGYEFVQVKDILYLKASGSYCEFFLKSGKSLISSKNLKFFEAILDGYGFYRIHHSSLVNLAFIKKLSKTAGGSVVMDNDEILGIAKSRKDELLQLLSL